MPDSIENYYSQLNPSGNEPEYSTDPDAPVIIFINDTYIPYPTEGSSIGDLIAVVTIKQGTVRKNDQIELITKADTPIATKVTRLLTKAQPSGIDEASASGSDSVGVALDGIKRDDVRRGDLLVKPGSFVRAAGKNNFTATVYFFTPEEIGQKTPAIIMYDPLVEFSITDAEGARTSRATFKFSNAEGASSGKPLTSVDVYLTKKVSLKEGQRFRVLDSGRLIGVGVVSEVTS